MFLNFVHFVGMGERTWLVAVSMQDIQKISETVHLGKRMTVIRVKDQTVSIQTFEPFEQVLGRCNGGRNLNAEEVAKYSIEGPPPAPNKK